MPAVAVRLGRTEAPLMPRAHFDYERTPWHPGPGSALLAPADEELWTHLLQHIALRR